MANSMNPGFSQQLLMETASTFGTAKFSTLDMAERLAATNATEWNDVLQHYGAGGKGAGRHYSSFSRLSQALNKLHNDGLIYKRDYEPAPTGYGSHIIRYWSIFEGAIDYFYPDEPHPDESFSEGAVVKIKVNRYERSVKARDACIAHYGAKCFGCCDELGDKYGARGVGLVHVHHLKPLSAIGIKYQVDPIKDLRPVCPNCHAIIHRGEEMLTMEELQLLVKA